MTWWGMLCSGSAGTQIQSCNITCTAREALGNSHAQGKEITHAWASQPNSAYIYIYIDLHIDVVGAGVSNETAMNPADEHHNRLHGQHDTLHM